jgi:hypothetical protein
MQDQPTTFRFSLRALFIYTALTALGLLALKYPFVWRNPATDAQSQAARLTDEQMLQRAVEAVTNEAHQGKARRSKPRVAAVQSNNTHLGRWQMANPLREYGFYCALLDNGLYPIRHFLAVSRSGQVVSPLDIEEFTELVVAEDKSRWKDEDYLNAATLYVHLTSAANEDGWRLLAKPEDFTAINFAMAAIGPGVEKQKDAAKQIVAPKIEQEGGHVTAMFYAWHLIGGYLRRWHIQIGPKVKASCQELGQFGGGGYD